MEREPDPMYDPEASQDAQAQNEDHILELTEADMAAERKAQALLQLQRLEEHLRQTLQLLAPQSGTAGDTFCANFNVLMEQCNSCVDLLLRQMQRLRAVGHL